MSNTVEIVVKGTDQSGAKTLKGVADDTKRVGEHAKGASSGLKTMAVAGATLAGVGLVKFLKDSVTESRESQKVNAQTAAVLKSTGNAAHITASQIGDLATSISNKTGIDDEAIQSSENMLLTFTNVRNEVGKGNDIFNQATQTVTDMSVALGTDAKQSAIQLGKALNDPIKGITALQRVGVTFTEEQKKMIKHLVETGDRLGAQKIILKELNKEFGGSAAAQATAGEKMATTWKNFQESVGNALTPIIDKMLPKLASLVSWAGDHADLILKLAAAFAGLLVALKIYEVADRTTTAIKGIANAFGAIKGKATDAASAVMSFGGMGGALTVAGVGLGLIAIAGKGLVDWLNRGALNFDKIAHSADNFSAALDATGGKIDETVIKTAALQIQQTGVADKAKRAGVNLDQLTEAVTGTDDQLDNLIATMRRNGGSSKSLELALISLHRQFGNSQSKAQAVANTVNHLSAAYKAVPRNVQTYIRGIDGASGVIRGVDRLLRTLDGRIVYTSIITQHRNIYTVEDAASNRGPAGVTGRTGGIWRAAAGGIRSGYGLVGEEGPELVKLPRGSMVYPAGQTRGMLSRMGGGGGGVVKLEINSGGSKMDDLLVELLRKAIRTRGGDVQLVLGR